MLSTVRAKYTKLDKKYRQRNVELAEEYKRMTEQYKDLQTKFSHFQEYDSQKYKEVWNLSTDRMRESVNQVLKADKVIHEQLLNLVWYPPQEDIFQLPKRTSTSTKSSTLPTPSPSLPSLTSTSSFSTNSLPRHLPQVLALIRQEASFLTKSGIKPDSVAEMESAILRTLGIDSDSDAAKLVSLFVVGEEDFEIEKEKENNDENDNNEDGEDGQIEKETEKRPILIKPSQVMDALTAFTRIRNEQRERDRENDEYTKNGSRRGREKDRMSDEAVKEFWERITNVIPESVTNNWDKLEQEMIKYNQILKERVNLLQGNESLRQQNNELKGLLNQYLNAKINEELIVPPVSLPPQRKVSSSSSSRAKR